MSYVVLERKPELIETPTYVELTILCDSFRSLPSAGGVLDQDQLVMRRIAIVREAQAERQKLEEDRRKRKEGKK
jgi:hypothetical protein